MHHARGNSRVLAFLFAYSVIAFALYAIVTMAAPALGSLTSSG
jgi:hypothetical protein